MIRSLKTVVAGLLAGTVLVVSGVSGIAPAAAAPAAQVTLSPGSGPAGSAVTATGTGFKASTSGTVTAGASSFSFKTSGTGSFSTGIVIPAGATGSLTVTAKTSATKASALFVVQPAVVTEPQPPVISSAKLRFGVATQGGASAGAELDAVGVLAGESPSMVLMYKDFLQAPPLAELDAVSARGATALLTWEPWAWGGGVEQPAFSLDRITAGDFDAHIRAWGQSLASWGKPVMLRFAHEMNGNWYPWAEGVNSNQAGDYVSAWRHVHDVVAAQGAANVQWVWSPNVPYWGSTDLTGLYPGAGYVDVVALDGYNWGTSAAWSSWVSPQDLFSPGIAQLRTLAPGSQILVAETAASELGGSKAAWNRDLVAYLASQPDVMGFVWFHLQKEADWRINSSESSATALKAALVARRS
ncbi:glycoside hydrolase family 26 protein [Arthrobacter sp. G.S.26]|uniref:glycoside hydrolase family 26 protein n=1 Tax=Micrococcaceae TaxID=1268 RepID=UPI00255480DF|nr:glycosyl hydrolase [Pseudarthrobacter sp. MEB009]